MCIVHPLFRFLSCFYTHGVFSATGPPETGAMATYAWMKTSLGILAYVFSPPVAQAHRGQKAHCAS